MPLTVKTGAMKVKDPSSGNYVDVDMSLGVDYAPINSPEFAGTPKAPTATSETNNTQIATTAFVQGLVSTEASARQAADSALQGSLNDVKAIKTIAQLSDLSVGESHFVVFSVNINVGGITIPRHSRGVLVSSTGSDATLYTIDTNGNLYVSYRNSGTWSNTKNITADISALDTKTTERLIYQDNGSYANNIGVNLDLTEAVEGHSFLKVVTFLGSIASSTRIIFLYPIGGGACYLSAPVDANYNYVRCEAHDKIFSIISSSYSTLYVRSIGLIL